MKARNPYKPRVARDYDGTWAVLLDNRWRLCGTWREAITAALDRCHEHSAGCGQPGCPCQIPGPVCCFREDDLAGYPFCPRCGWSRHLHLVVAA